MRRLLADHKSILCCSSSLAASYWWYVTEQFSFGGRLASTKIDFKMVSRRRRVTTKWTRPRRPGVKYNSLSMPNFSSTLQWFRKAYWKVTVGDGLSHFLVLPSLPFLFLVSTALTPWRVSALRYASKKLACNNISKQRWWCHVWILSLKLICRVSVGSSRLWMLCSALQYFEESRLLVDFLWLVQWQRCCLWYRDWGVWYYLCW